MILLPYKFRYIPHNTFERIDIMQDDNTPNEDDYGDGDIPPVDLPQEQ